MQDHTMGGAYWDILEQHGTNMCAERNIQLLSILLEPLANTFLTMSNIVYMWQFQIGGQDGCSTIPIPDRSRLGDNASSGILDHGSTCHSVQNGTTRMNLGTPAWQELSDHGSRQR